MSYTAKEVKGLLKNFHTLKEARDTNHHGLNTLIRVADMERALRRLAAEDAFLGTIVALTIKGETTREIGGRINLSHVTIQTRLGEAIDWIVRYLNEGVVE